MRRSLCLKPFLNSIHRSKMAQKPITQKSPSSLVVITLVFSGPALCMCGEPCRPGPETTEPTSLALSLKCICEAFRRTTAGRDTIDLASEAMHLKLQEGAPLTTEVFPSLAFDLPREPTSWHRRVSFLATRCKVNEFACKWGTPVAFSKTSVVSVQVRALMPTAPLCLACSALPLHGQPIRRPRNGMGAQQMGEEGSHTALRDTAAPVRCPTLAHLCPLRQASSLSRLETGLL